MGLDYRFHCNLPWSNTASRRSLQSLLLSVHYYKKLGGSHQSNSVMFSWIESLLQIQSLPIIRTTTYITRSSQLGFFFLGRQSLYLIRQLLRTSNHISHKLHKHIQSQPNSKKVNLLFCEYYKKLHEKIQVHQSNQNQGKEKKKQTVKLSSLCDCCSRDNLLSSQLMQKLINLLMVPMNIIIVKLNQYALSLAKNLIY